MSETTSDYTAAPGVQALQAGYEEGQAWQALALALLTLDQRTALRVVAGLPADDPAGWIRAGRALGALYEDYYRVYEALLTLPACLVERLEAYGTVSGYRLTPFGARVAAALGEG